MQWIWNEDRSGYRQELQDEIMGPVSISTDTGAKERSGGVFVIHADQISEEAGVLIQAVAKAIFTDDWGTFESRYQVPRVENYEEAMSTGQDQIFFNGLGGFTKNGREYIIRIAPGQATPVPWSNVISNPNFGTVISESSGAYTWSKNSQQFRLTPWYNDPVTQFRVRETINHRLTESQSIFLGARYHLPLCFPMCSRASG